MDMEVEGPRTSWVEVELLRVREEEEHVQREAHRMVHLLFAFSIAFLLVLGMMVVLVGSIHRLVSSTRVGRVGRVEDLEDLRACTCSSHLPLAIPPPTLPNPRKERELPPCPVSSAAHLV